MLVGVDIGSTHLKAGAFDEQGRLLALANRANPAHQHTAGYACYDPQALWESVAAAVREACASAGAPAHAVGVTSMAETGLLVDTATGQPRTTLIPWFDTNASAQAERIRLAADSLERFGCSGIYPSFKCSLAKLLWLKEALGIETTGAVWLSTADYIAYRLTHELGTDFSLAGRTYAFRLDNKEWDGPWLAEFGLEPGIFPRARQGGTVLGTLVREAAADTGLPAHTPVAVCGHDHLCAALAAGAYAPGPVFDSMGTAETLLGAMPERLLGEREFRSGLTYGCHVVEGQFYWMGGLSSSGGSVEWLRSLLGEPPLDYVQIEALAASGRDAPTGILYFPYLAGSGAPHTDPHVRGAFAGLNATHGRADLARAVLEGTAYEMEFIRRAAEEATGQPMTLIRAAGGGTRNRTWMQIKADVSNARFELLALPDATLLGAAAAAGLGAGVFASAADMHAALATSQASIVEPRPEYHREYRRHFEHGFLRLQHGLRHLARMPLAEPTQVH